MPQMVGLDFETYGSVNLPDHGLHRYVGGPGFRPLIASVAIPSDYEKTKVFVKRLDFVHDYSRSKHELSTLLSNKLIVAHNAGFEAAVLSHLGLHYPAELFLDSAVVARAAGAGSSLEASAAQLLDTDKMAAGKDLMRLFSIPGKYQEASGSGEFDPAVVADHPQEWETYGEYCDLDATLSLLLAMKYQGYLTFEELIYHRLTMEMNQVGWPVDIPLVEEMHRRYLENLEVTLADFQAANGAAELNLNSLKQLKEWCAERGVKATSFDEKNVDRLIGRIGTKIFEPGVDPSKLEGYSQVLAMLKTKRTLGGSSLKKLKVILDTAVETPDGWRLKDQYLHCGAGQTLRTTGRSVQMQNLKRLSVVGDMEELEDPGIEWDNDKLAENLRQLFVSSHPQGRLIVGDFSSVESRGLAWQAKEEWKLQAYRDGKDLYKVLASKITGTPYDLITKEQRQFGKVGELSCGYQAGPGAVKEFASNMGVPLSEGEATKLVYDWREANPATVEYWDQLDQALHSVLSADGHVYTVRLSDGCRLTVHRVNTPTSLLKQVAAKGTPVVSLGVTISKQNRNALLTRYFHGCHVAGRNIRYFKPSARKTGDLWSDRYTDPKTKQLRFREIYGGKLAGIATQSLCRELFFQSLTTVAHLCKTNENLQLVGQFHDEIVMDWKPGPVPLKTAEEALKRSMSAAVGLPSFPLAAEVKSAYRYIK